VTIDPHESSIEDAVAYRIHRTNRLLLTHLGRFLDTHDADLTPEKYFVIMKLHEAGPIPQGELVEGALHDRPNVSRLVDRLVAAGFVERAEDPTDGRARVLELTTHGRALARRLKADAPDEHRVVFDGVTNTDLDALAKILDRLYDNLRPALLGARR